MRRYNEDAIELALRNRARQPFRSRHLDDAGSIWFQRELQAIEATMLEQPYGPLKAAQVMPLQFDIPLGAREWGFNRIRRQGKADWLAGKAKDIPTVSASAEQDVFPLRLLGVAAEWSIEDAWAGAYTGRPLPTELAIAARRAVDQFINNVMLFGDTQIGLTGFINDATVGQGNATNGAWSGNTGDEIVQAISDAFLDVWDGSNEVYKPNVVAIPRTQYARIQTTRLSSDNNVTMLSFIMANIEGLEQIIPLDELVGAGVGATDRMVVYRRSPEVLVGKGCTPFMTLPIQEDDLSFWQIYLAKIAGMVWRTPIAAVYRDGI